MLLQKLELRKIFGWVTVSLTAYHEVLADWTELLKRDELESDSYSFQSVLVDY